MARLLMGRNAVLYVSDSAFTASGLVALARGKDFTVTDEAAEVQGSARDMEYDVFDVGSKTFGVEVEVNEIAVDPDAGTARALVQAAYDGNTELYVVICKGDKAVDSGKAIKFKGKVFSHGLNLPEGDMATVPITIKPSDPDNPPTRVATPLA